MLWIVTLSRRVVDSRCFDVMYRLHIQGSRSLDFLSPEPSKEKNINTLSGDFRVLKNDASQGGRWERRL